jgi:hypothetical protein
MNRVIEVGFQWLYIMGHSLRPLLIPICFLVAWGGLILGLWTVWALIRDSVARAKQMHRIPCADCRYFSGDYHLKCPVHPQSALSELAIDCVDFEASDPIARHHSLP